MRLLVESGRVVAVGGLVAIAVGVLRGLPEPPPPPPEALSCAPPGSPGAEPGTPPAEVRWITQDDARALVGDGATTFVDARPRTAFEVGHVAGALSVPIDETGTVDPQALALLRGAHTVVAYCDTTGGCAASTRLAYLLAIEGLPDVRVLQGGIDAWVEHGFPAEAGTCRLCP